METNLENVTPPVAVARSGFASDVETDAHGVSWGAIFAGAVATAALSLILLVLGFGLGLSALSPWSRTGATVTAIGTSAIAWLLVSQIIASGLGGYIAGRLRCQWLGIHTDEVYFRDTAHGFLSWALATVIAAAVLTGAASSVVSGGAHVAAIGAGGMMGGMAAPSAGEPGSPAAAMGGSPMGDGGRAMGPMNPMVGYFSDTLFRSDKPSTDGSDASTRAEGTRLFAMGLRHGDLSPADRTYLAQLVANKTGLSPDDAQKRVNDTLTQAKAQMNQAEEEARKATDTARKAAAHTALWMFIALLAGAFFASVAATVGGRRRDDRAVLDPAYV